MSRKKTFTTNDLLDRIAETHEQNTDTQLTGTITVHRMLIAWAGTLQLATLLQFILWLDTNTAGYDRSNREFVEDEHRDAFVTTVAELVEYTGLSEYHVYKGLNILTEAGLLTTTKANKRYGKHLQARVYRRFHYNRFVELVTAYMEEPIYENVLYRTYRGLDDAEGDPNRDGEAHWDAIPCSTERLEDPEAAISDEWVAAARWGAGIKELRKASDTVILYSYVLKQVTAHESTVGLSPTGLSAGRWTKDMEALIRASDHDLNIARTAFMEAWEYAKANNKVQWYVYPSSFLKWVAGAKAKARADKRDARRNKDMTKAQKQVGGNTPEYTDLTYAEILALGDDE